MNHHGCSSAFPTGKTDVLCPLFALLRCDNCLIATMLIMQQIACILRCVAMITGSDELQGIADIMTLIADLLYCSVCACMQTQHKMEMDVRDGKLAPKVRLFHLVS